MRILLDENFPKSAADVIAAAGHEVFSFADVCEFGADDEEVIWPCAETGRSDPDFRSGFLSHRATDSSRALRNHCRGLASAESKGNPDAIAMVLREFRLPDGESGFHSLGLFLPR